MTLPDTNNYFTKTYHQMINRVLITSRNKLFQREALNRKTGQRVQSGSAPQELCLRSIPPHFCKCQFIWRVWALIPMRGRQARSPSYPCRRISGVGVDEGQRREILITETQSPKLTDANGRGFTGNQIQNLKKKNEYLRSSKKNQLELLTIPRWPDVKDCCSPWTWRQTGQKQTMWVWWINNKCFQRKVLKTTNQS